MQTYCVDTIGASCALVVVFPNTTMDGNPGNCGNACSCAKSVRGSGDEHRHHTCQDFLLPFLRLGEKTLILNKQCPAIPPSCQDPSCLGDQDSGCLVNSETKGCKCTGTVLIPKPPAFRKNVTAYNNDPRLLPSAKCPSDIYCSDPGCEGSVNNDGNGGLCRAISSTGCPCNLWY